MNVYYNSKGISDVLLIPLKQADRDEIKFEMYGPIAKITDKANVVIGYNIFQASTYLNLPNEGKIILTEKLVDDLKGLFQKEQLNDSLDFDLSPKFVVGYVTDKQAHENADKLSVCQVDVGSEMLQIVCGAPNVDKGQKVVVAKTGAIMPSGMQIKPTKLRGVPSNGMICSQKELGLPNAPEEKGIYVLDDSYAIGEPFLVD